MLYVLPVPLHQLLLLVLKKDVNLHFSIIRVFSGLVSVCVGEAWLVLTTLLSMPGSSSYPRLYVPSQIPRQTNLDTSPATLFLSGKMHEIVLDGTDDGAV